MSRGLGYREVEDLEDNNDVIFPIALSVTTTTPTTTPTTTTPTTTTPTTTTPLPTTS